MVTIGHSLLDSPKGDASGVPNRKGRPIKEMSWKPAVGGGRNCRGPGKKKALSEGMNRAKQVIGRGVRPWRKRRHDRRELAMPTIGRGAPRRKRAMGNAAMQIRMPDIQAKKEAPTEVGAQ